MFSARGLARVADDLRILAEKEGLTAHAASVDLRLSADVSPVPPNGQWARRL